MRTSVLLRNCLGKLTLTLSGVALLSLSQFQIVCALDEIAPEGNGAVSTDLSHCHSSASSASDPYKDDSDDVAGTTKHSEKHEDDPCCQDSEKVVLRVEPSSSLRITSDLSFSLPISILTYNEFFNFIVSFYEREGAGIARPPPLANAISTHISSTILRV